VNNCRVYTGAYAQGGKHGNRTVVQRTLNPQQNKLSRRERLLIRGRLKVVTRAIDPTDWATRLILDGARVDGFKSMAKFLGVNELTLRCARAASAHVRRVIVKEGGRYSADANELTNLHTDLWFRSQGSAGKSAAAYERERKKRCVRVAAAASAPLYQPSRRS
jgi:hypothetical protein